MVEIAVCVRRRPNGVIEVAATGTRAAEAEMAKVRPRKVRRRGWRGLGMEAHRGAVQCQGVSGRVCAAAWSVCRSFTHSLNWPLSYKRQIDESRR